MIWTLLGALVGIILGLTIDVSIPTPYIKYTAVIIRVVLDSLFGAAKAEVSKEYKKECCYAKHFLINVWFSGHLKAEELPDILRVLQPMKERLNELETQMNK